MNKAIAQPVQWCIEQHEKTNHLYDDYLPYEFHLRLVAQMAYKFAHLLPETIYPTVHLACYGHDLIEDTRCSYNDCKKALGKEVADIIYAVTNEKGKNRKERANDRYYLGIRNTPYADFVKLCDRIANVQYSRLIDSLMLELYRKENEYFLTQIGGNYMSMNEFLNDLLK